MKPKPKRHPRWRLYRRLPELRILQLSNDLSEGIASGDVLDWRAVAEYWRHQFDLEERKLSSVQPSISAMCAGLELIALSKVEIKRWLDDNYPPLPVPPPQTFKRKTKK